MSGTRVHELAKELSLSSKDIVSVLQKKGFEVKSHMSVLTKEMVSVVKKEMVPVPEKKASVKKAATPEKKKAPSTKVEEKKKETKKKVTEDKAKSAAKKKEKDEARTPEKKSKGAEPVAEKGQEAVVEKEVKPEKAASKEAEKKPVKKSGKKASQKEMEVLELSRYITVRQMASRLKRKTKEIMVELRKRGINAGANQSVDLELVEEIAEEFGYLVEFINYEHEMLSELEKPDDPASLKPRIPVVTFMGHVDHGKTSLLDKIRSSHITDRESGGITQHIGAYQIDVGGKRITFLDTPGHEAFTLMRARGADVTDIVILVVAAEEGLKPQTIEAINHSQAAGVSIIVALNKVDKPEANPDRVKQQLLEHGLVAEDYGGDVIMVEVSAKTGKGIDELIEYIFLVAEMLDLKADPIASAKGSIIEARVDKGKGPVATVLVQNGTLKVGEIFTCGVTSGKVRAMFNEHGTQLDEAGPSDPVEILGFSDVPMAGDKFYVVTDESLAREIAEAKQLHSDEMNRSEPAKKLSLEELFRRVEDDGVKELPIILKCDVQGSVETIEAMLNKLTTRKVKLNVIHKGVGAISENDVLLASASNAIVLGFHVRADKKTVALAQQEGIEIRTHNIIYELTNEIRAAMLGMLEPDVTEEVIGHAEVRQVFKVPKIGFIAGCYVTDGMITRKGLARVYRDNIMIQEGRLGSLKRFKDDASEVKQGFECGISIENMKDIREGDEIEIYVKKETAATLD
ncbi:MAG: translation initiation factor IF-2 [Acidobacteria bacterium CG_4_9_14_3_um_filter_49_7]|nr:MAG: translation initiation factor IF-2 [Acidobacteria bacterium CG_4_9_14_3_um_filter_49_7]